MTWNDSGAKTNVTLTSHQQPVPKMNPTNGLIDCLSGWTNNGTFNTNLIWQRSYTLAIPTNWVSGVYVARLTTGTNVAPQTTGKQSYLIFTVREDARTSDLLYQASVTTWQAYNPWGGSSLYAYPYCQRCDGLDVTNSFTNVVCRLGGTVSFNRPYAAPSCGNNWYPPVYLGYGSGAGKFLTMINRDATPALEYNMVRWLERQGYEVTYSTSVDTHRTSPANKAVKTFISVGHDEYWSASQRSNVEGARDRGVNLFFSAGNVCWWQIHFDPGERAFAVNRVADADLWRGSQANNSTAYPAEISMIGVEYVANTIRSDMKMANPLATNLVAGGVHWAYEHTGLTNGQTLSGLLGYEVDGSWDSSAGNGVNSASPASGTVRLASSPFSYDTYLGHSFMTIYTACNGAQVFATGSMQWNWGLDDFAGEIAPPPPYGPFVHPAAQQMTHNLLRTFSGKTTAPVIFTNADPITSWNWIASYGTNYLIANITTLTNLPSYAQVTITNQHVQVWTNLSTDPRALLIPGSSNRIASAWTTTNSQGSSVTIDLNLTDTNTHRIALYCVDWLGTGTVLEKIEVFDSNDTFFSHPLDMRSFQLPANGVYLVWNLKGHNIFRITKPDATTGNKAMVSAVFVVD